MYHDVYVQFSFIGTITAHQFTSFSSRTHLPNHNDDYKERVQHNYSQKCMIGSPHAIRQSVFSFNNIKRKCSPQTRWKLSRSLAYLLVNTGCMSYMLFKLFVYIQYTELISIFLDLFFLYRSCPNVMNVFYQAAVWTRNCKLFLFGEQVNVVIYWAWFCLPRKYTFTFIYEWFLFEGDSIYKDLCLWIAIGFSEIKKIHKLMWLENQ